MNVLRRCACLTLVACLVTPLWAKGPTTRIVISSPSLSAPIEITDPRLLDDIVVLSGPGTSSYGNPGASGFIVDWSANVTSQRPSGLPRYDVSFYVARGRASATASREELAYIVRYEPDWDAGRGYIYLPGRDDDVYRLNVRTILRGVEGQWYRATDAWHELAAGLISPRR